MGKAADLTRHRFGRLRVTALADPGREPSGKSVRRWRCVCDCGNEVIVRAASLTKGRTQSCGCLNTETRSRLLIERATLHGAAAGGKVSPEYSSWAQMIGRCHNPRNHKFRLYGARGIAVCDRWRNSFAAFFEDMGPKPTPQHSIDRINNDGSYEPSNCRWATRVEQARNKSVSRHLTLNGTTRTLPEWSEVTGISQKTLRSRLSYGWSDEQTLTRAVRGRGR